MDYDAYILRLEDECDKIYQIAEKARSKGLDPRSTVEIPRASDLADRTQKLLDFLHPRQTADQIRELTAKHDGNRELVAIDIARIVTGESLLYGIKENCQGCKGSGEIAKTPTWKVSCDDCNGSGEQMGFKSDIGSADWKETLVAYESKARESRGEHLRVATCLYHGICAGLAVLTEGILVAPLEGVVSCRILSNEDASECLAVNYAGPIRSAGGTGQALSVLIADILRRDFGFTTPQVTFSEVERYKEEVSKYSRGLQYRPSNPQLEVIAQNCPVYVDGEGVGDEVTGQRDLPRVPTNKVREGMLLVMCEGLVLKAPKILKYVEELELDGWDWLKSFVQTKSGATEIKPSDKYMSDVLAGRPIFGLPMQVGGLRLRYGRSRLGGLAATAMHPVTMMAMGGFVICGTQMKYERPGKATVATPCDSIDGPYLQLNDGSAKRFSDSNELLKLGGLESGDDWSVLPTQPEWPIKKIWDLGELLVPVGEFIENNHPLAPSPYVSEWHEQVLENKGIAEDKSFEEAVTYAQTYDIPLNPKYVPTGLQDVSAEELKVLLISLNHLDDYQVPDEQMEKVYRLCVDVTKDGYLKGSESFLIKDAAKELFGGSTGDESEDSCEYVGSILNISIRPRTTMRIGARMGKPEGSKHREMNPPVHGLWPVGYNIGPQRRIRDAARKGESFQVGIRVCGICDQQTWRGVCCEHDTAFVGLVKQDLDTESTWKECLETTHQATEPEVKGSKGLRNAEKMPEDMLKAVLRHKNGTSVFRDGTIRFDMVDITMTHFRPDEIGITAARAVELGYTTDCKGNPVVSDDQVIELMPQDIVIAQNCVQSLLAAMNFTDSMLETMYGLEAFYEAENEQDLVGQLIMGLAPHTSGAVLGRIIGITPVKGHYGHPFYHAAKRRNCDGDIDCILLLMEGLINFSRMFLPKSRGGRMDAPLTLTTRILATEIDKEALNVDIGWKYPVDFYELTHSEIPPRPKKALDAGIIIVETLTDAGERPVGKMGYTHETSSCSAGPKNNPYNTLEGMRRKTMEQFALGTILTSVDNTEQASKLIDRHLIRDMRGNLRAYGQQKVRCPKCSASYRRVPVSGKCRTIMEKKTDPFTGEEIETLCPGKLILTVTEGGVGKYGGLMQVLIETYGCNDYIEGLYNQVSKWVAETFESKELGKQQKLF